VGRKNAFVEIEKASLHNLKKVDLALPLERLVAITGYRAPENRPSPGM